MIVLHAELEAEFHLEDRTTLHVVGNRCIECICDRDCRWFGCNLVDKKDCKGLNVILVLAHNLGMIRHPTHFCIIGNLLKITSQHALNLSSLDMQARNNQTG